MQTHGHPRCQCGCVEDCLQKRPSKRQKSASASSQQSALYKKPTVDLRVYHYPEVGLRAQQHLQHQYYYLQACIYSHVKNIPR